MASKFLALLIALLIPAIGPAHAQERAVKPKGVIELYTSQGCSFCPSADRALATLVDRPDIIALAFHVDYWNYRGWTDPLASPANTARQYGYARTLGRSGVYTPQAVLNGREQMKGKDAGALDRQLDGLARDGKGLSVDVDVRRTDDELVIDIGAGSGKADVLVVYYRQRQDTDILKGENKGTRVSNWNSVTDIQTVGMWEGKQMRVVLPSNILERRGDDGCAILVQTTSSDGEPSVIVGATKLEQRDGS